jgi:hypothetical protein
MGEGGIGRKVFLNRCALQRWRRLREEVNYGGDFLGWNAGELLARNKSTRRQAGLLPGSALDNVGVMEGATNLGLPS